MRSFENRLRKIEESLPPKTGDGFDLVQALSFRWAGIPRCVGQARVILILDRYARRPGCTDEEMDVCQRQIAAIVPAFSFETSRDITLDPLFHDDDHQLLMDAAWKIIRELPEEVERTR